MKRHIELPELVQFLSEEQTQKRDIIVPSKLMRMQAQKLYIDNYRPEYSDLYDVFASAGISTSGDSQTEFSSTKMLHEDLAGKLDIPRGYYDRMLTKSPELLDANVTNWLRHKDNEKTSYMLRTFERGNGERIGRCLLSDRYFVIDHLDILFSVLEVIKENGMNMKITDCDITEKNMYVRFTCPDIEIQAPEILKNYRVPKGGDDGNPSIISGFVIKNSETGDGGLTVSPRAEVLACRNGLIRKEDAFKKIHLGGKLQETYIDWSKETLRKNMALIQAQMVDCVRKFSSKEYLTGMVHEIVQAGTQELKHPVDCTKNVCKSLNMSDEKMNEIMGYFITGGQNTAFGVSQALTYFAHETDNADTQYEMECVGYDIITKIDEYDRPTKK